MIWKEAGNLPSGLCSILNISYTLNEKGTGPDISVYFMKFFLKPTGNFCSDTFYVHDTAVLYSNLCNYCSFSVEKLQLTIKIA